jgi:hypothetical protein
MKGEMVIYQVLIFLRCFSSFKIKISAIDIWHEGKKPEESSVIASSMYSIKSAIEDYGFG